MLSNLLSRFLYRPDLAINGEPEFSSDPSVYSHLDPTETTLSHETVSILVQAAVRAANQAQAQHNERAAGEFGGIVDCLAVMLGLDRCYLSETALGQCSAQGRGGRAQYMPVGWLIPMVDHLVELVANRPDIELIISALQRDVERP